MRTVKLTIRYDGTEYVGWQRQDAGTSIQGLLEDALAKIEGHRVAVHGAGRTDAGAHALAQVASARIASVLDNATLLRALNANLPPAVRVFGVESVHTEFHARFDAVSKTYEYRIWNGPALPPFVRLYAWHVPQPLARGILERGASQFVGSHDFAAFQGADSIVHTTVRTVTCACWRGGGPDAALVFEITGDGFLRHMVRSIVGTLVEAAHGRRPVEDIQGLLAAPDRSRVGRTAPPHGLFLARVTYR
jgi:tRNA pseudouridine38-40 synthase